MTNLLSAAGPRQHHVQCASPAGLHRIAYTEWGDSANPHVLLCVHGLTRSGRDFDRLAQALADRYRVICPDVAGRGLSDWLANPALYAIPQYVADIVTLIARLDVEQVDWFGTSMGGLIGMALAGLPKTPIRKMIINDVGPHIEAEALARIGEYVGQAPRFASERDGIEQLALLAQSFGPLDAGQWREINAPLLRRDGDGWVVRYDPAISAPFRTATPEAIALGEDQLWRSVESFAGPMLVVRGAESDLLSRETAAQMRARGQHVEFVEIPGVGHAPAFVAPEQIALARQFLLG